MRFFGGGDGKQSKRKKRSVDDGLFPEITATKRRRSKRELDSNTRVYDVRFSLLRPIREKKSHIMCMSSLISNLITNDEVAEVAMSNHQTSER